MRYLRIAVVAAVAFCSAAAFRQISWYPPEDVLVIWVRGTPDQTAIYRESLEDYLARHPDACWRSPYSCCASAGSLAASSSVFAIDIYPLLDREVSEQKALKVGRIAAITILIWAIFTAPVIQHLGLVYLLMHKVTSYLLPAIGVCYVIGRFNKRINSFGAIFTMSLGFVIGTSLLLFSTLPTLIPYCPDIILHSNFYHVNFFLVLIYAAILLISSHFRSAPKPEDLAFMQPTIAEQQQRAATLERVGVLGSFKFWFVVYICGFVGVYLLF